ncbi:MAG: hypothetical protein ACOCW2_01060 [Chitinivibrionales bacterium]
MKKEPEDDFEKGLQEILTPGEKNGAQKPPKSATRENQQREPVNVHTKPAKKISHRTEIIIRIISALIAALLLGLFVIQTALR